MLVKGLLQVHATVARCCYQHPSEASGSLHPARAPLPCTIPIELLYAPDARNSWWWRNKTATGAISATDTPPSSLPLSMSFSPLFWLFQEAAVAPQSVC